VVVVEVEAEQRSWEQWGHAGSICPPGPPIGEERLRRTVAASVDELVHSYGRFGILG
jgi:hypothetical protein